MRQRRGSELSRFRGGYVASETAWVTTGAKSDRGNMAPHVSSVHGAREIMQSRGEIMSLATIKVPRGEVNDARKRTESREGTNSI